MADETPAGFGQIRDSAGNPEGGAGEQSPLQARAAFLQNWNWESVVSLNRALCERGGAQHGSNSESFAQTASEWNQKRGLELTLGEALDYLRNCHKSAPFLFYNGNTFAEIARNFSDYLFAELPHSRRRQATSAVAHFVAGVLDKASTSGILESLCRTASFQPGDRVKTFRGSSHGVIVRILEDGRVGWRPDGSGAELIALPESLLKEE